ncbi:MAG: ABC transporter substrate-binding protein [Acidimicrobiales bacterium]
MTTSTPPRKRILRILPILLLGAALILVGACGDNADDAGGPGGSATTENASGIPKRIVSLSPTATEMLFAIDAGEQVVAVDDQSNFPPEAPITDLSGYQPNVEAIAGYQPDLVVLSGDAGGVVAGLNALGITTRIDPAARTLDDTYGQIAELGMATGHEDAAAALVAGMRKGIDEQMARVPKRPQPLTYYHELEDTLFTATSQTFIGEVYRLAGLENVADPADADGQSGGYPQLSPEFLVDADPDVIFLADTKCCQQTAETVAARPGFGGLSALANGRVVELDDDVASRWGPRIVELLRTVVDATAAVPVG